MTVAKVLKGCRLNLRERLVDIETHVYMVLKAKGSHGGGSVFVIVVSFPFLLFAGKIM